MTQSADPPTSQPVAVANAPEAVLAHQLSRADTIRQRAQYAATVSGAAGAAVATAGGLADLHRYPTVVQVAVYVSLVAWLVSVAFYIYTIAGPADLEHALSGRGGSHAYPVSGEDTLRQRLRAKRVRRTNDGRPDPQGRGLLRIDLDVMIDDYTQNATTIRRRLRLAQRVSRVALALTVLAFLAVGVAAEEEDEPALATLAVSEELARAVGFACGREESVNEFDATVRFQDISEATVDLSIRDPRRCRGDRVEMRVRSTGILAATKKEAPPRNELEENRGARADGVVPIRCRHGMTSPPSGRRPPPSLRRCRSHPGLPPRRLL